MSDPQNALGKGRGLLQVLTGEKFIHLDLRLILSLRRAQRVRAALAHLGSANRTRESFAASSSIAASKRTPSPPCANSRAAVRRACVPWLNARSTPLGSPACRAPKTVARDRDHIAVSQRVRAIVSLLSAQAHRCAAIT